jgi:hypothetical protein
MAKENRFFHPDDYKNFRTWDELAYIIETITSHAQNVSKEEMKDYCESLPKRVGELSETNPQFKQDYDDYLKLRNSNRFDLSGTDEAYRLNKKSLILKDIKLAVKDWSINNEETMKKQSLIRNKYSSRFSKYRKEANQNNKSNNKDIEIISATKKVWSV